jgi:beta-galactosidase
MFAVAVQDAHGRVLPITDNHVTFKLSGEGKLMGTGNGDPTDHAPDQGTSRKAFSGCCLAVVQSTKTAGSITVEATSPGLTTTTVTIPTKSVRLRPQVAVWQREVPSGPGVTGLWRPIPASGNDNPLAGFLGLNGAMVFTIQQESAGLTGTVEGGGGGFFGGSDAPVPITDGKVDGTRISFKTGRTVYTGEVKGDQIELQRTISLGFEMPKATEPTGPRPAIGPPPDGTDPSFGTSFRLPPSISVVLRRAQR